MLRDAVGGEEQDVVGLAADREVRDLASPMPVASSDVEKLVALPPIRTLPIAPATAPDEVCVVAEEEAVPVPKTAVPPIAQSC